jgi:nitrogen fixation NifU-like protein
MAIDSFLDDLYREVIMDHYRSPRYRDVLEAPDITAEGYNPLCGDEVTLQLTCQDGYVKDVGVQVRGCSISQASGSMMAEQLVGKTLTEVEALIDTFQRMMQGERVEDVEEILGEDVEALSGVRKFPVRVKCALLPWTTLEEGLKGERT